MSVSSVTHLVSWQFPFTSGHQSCWAEAGTFACSLHSPDHPPPFVFTDVSLSSPSNSLSFFFLLPSKSL